MIYLDYSANTPVDEAVLDVVPGIGVCYTVAQRVRPADVD